MGTESFITIADSKNHYEYFVHFMDATTEALRLDGKNRKEYFLSRNGKMLEDDVLQCMRAKASDFHFDPANILPTKPQHFPDIISNNYFGVEVKSTEKNTWTSTGSSIVESLRDDDIKKVFLLFGILSKKNIDFRCKPYEKCLSDIHVTHSPRYNINMDLSDDDETIFDKMKIGYDTFRKLGETQIDKVKEYYRSIYKSKKAKTMPWWIGDTVQDLRLLCDLEPEMKEEFIAMSYALFPEILGNKREKYRKPSLWMCTRHSVICSNIRDTFSSKGKGNIYVNEQLRWENVPKVICTLTTVLDKIVDIYNDRSVIMEDFINFAIYPKKEEISLEQWIEAAEVNMRKTLKEELPDLTIRSLLELSYKEKITNNKKTSFFLTKKQPVLFS